MRVLGIETSCDETAAAVVTETGLVLSDVVRSQIEAHAPYGGVVPEIASRDHAAAIVPVVREALLQASMSPLDIDGIAVTTRPGLLGAILVGLSAAKGLAFSTGAPLVGVDHLVGHLLAVFLQRSGEEAPVPAFPFVALLASGGHTAIYRVDGPDIASIRELGATRDDAAGEAFDKVAKLLGLGYPGGPAVDKLAASGDASRAIAVLPRAMAQKTSLEFSFSGLKAAVMRSVAAAGAPPEGQALCDLCAAFQSSVVETLVEKTTRAARMEGIPRIVLAGGVAANRGLRARMAEVCRKQRISLFVPSFSSCTDNAAMIAYAGAQSLVAGHRDGLSLGPSTKTSLPRLTRKGAGLR